MGFAGELICICCFLLLPLKKYVLDYLNYRSFIKNQGTEMNAGLTKLMMVQLRAHKYCTGHAHTQHIRAGCVCGIFFCLCVRSLYMRRKNKQHLFYTSWKSNMKTMCVCVCDTQREIYSGCIYVNLHLRGVPSCICVYLCVDLSVYGGVCACWYVTYSCGNTSIYITAINHTEESRLFFCHLSLSISLFPLFLTVHRRL